MMLMQPEDPSKPAGSARRRIVSKVIVAHRKGCGSMALTGKDEVAVAGRHVLVRLAQLPVVDPGVERVARAVTQTAVAVPTRPRVARRLGVGLRRAEEYFVAAETEPVELQHLRMEKDKHQVADVSTRELCSFFSVRQEN